MTFKTLRYLYKYTKVFNYIHQLLNLHGLSHHVVGIHSLFLGPIIKLGLGPITYRPEGAASVLVGLVPPYCLLLAGKLANGALLHFPCSFLKFRLLCRFCLPFHPLDVRCFLCSDSGALFSKKKGPGILLIFIAL